MEIPKIETKLEVKNETNEGAAELYLYGTIRKAYAWEDSESVISSNGVQTKLENLKGKDINVHVNSGGGDVFESIAICNLLKQHNGNVNVYVDGMAGSGASVIATAGKNIYMFANSMQMIHKAWTIACGNADELRKTANDLEKIDTAVKASYKSKFVGTDEELTQLIAEESWLTAEECLAFGFATKIIDSEKQEEPKPQNNIKQTLFNKYGKNTDDNGTSILSAFKKKGANL